MSKSISSFNISRLALFLISLATSALVEKFSRPSWWPLLSPQHSTWPPDHDNRRLGTLSLLASIDLLTGEVTHILRERHRSEEFIEFLKLVDSKFPEGYVIVLILDNHFIHKSAETQRYMNQRQGRFRFVFTPVHASWLNIVETLFSRMARSFLIGIRVETEEKLKERIDMYFEEINREPVEFR
jgi:transposase